MNILLVYPETPTTFWSFDNALAFISKKSAEPPLGLLTVAALLPRDWNLKLIDMNVTLLKDKNILWADYVFLSGMNVQQKSFKEVIKRCNNLGVKIVAGGPMVTTDYQAFEGVDHFILNEAEITLPLFLKDLQAGTLQKIYQTPDFPDIENTPSPMWGLLDMKKYANMSVQYSRGCPFNCDFCNITLLNGHKPRLKTRTQFIGELDGLLLAGWRGSVFIVDDNFIGNKSLLKKDMLPALVEWSKAHKYPFNFTAEVSINLGDDPELVSLMREAGFDHVFIGIETPNNESLAECGKAQNLNRDMVQLVKFLHQQGLRVSGGFIVGFDNDPPNIFEKQINFIRNSGIVTAMVGVLCAPSGTKLYQRMQKENRLLGMMSGDNMDGATNIIPKMNINKLKEGYQTILQTIYSQREYYYRVKLFLTEYQPHKDKTIHLKWTDIKAMFKSIWVLGIREKGKRYYWKLIIYTLYKFPGKFALAVTMAIYGFHFRRVVSEL